MSHNGGNPIWMCLKVWKPPNPFKKKHFPQQNCHKMGRKILHPQSTVAGKSRNQMERNSVGNSKLKTAGIFQPRGGRESFPHVFYWATDSSNAQHLIESLGPWIGSAKPPMVVEVGKKNECHSHVGLVNCYMEISSVMSVPLNPRS